MALSSLLMGNPSGWGGTSAAASSAPATFFGASPAAMAQAGSVLGIGGAISGGIGSFFSALGQKNALRFQAQMDDMNALHAASAGTDQASQVLQRGGQMMATEKAGMAANGVELGDGSAAQVVASTDTMRQVDANTTVNNAMQQAFSYQADATLKRAAASAISPAMQGFSTLLTGASNVASQWAMGAGGIKKTPFKGMK